MSVDFSSLSSLSSVGPLDLSPDAAGVNGNTASDAARIKQVSKAMEKLFINQLTAELGKGLESTDGSDDASSEGSKYGDFIQKAMTDGVSQGGGFGLAKVIESYLNHDNLRAKHIDLNAVHTPHHAIRTN
jgi:Rod binding domain-containing protein